MTLIVWRRHTNVFHGYDVKFDIIGAKLQKTSLFILSRIYTAKLKGITTLLLGEKLGGKAIRIMFASKALPLPTKQRYYCTNFY